jgi:adenylate cyclase
MGRDENRAFEILRKNREIQKPLIERYHGKWIKELGDGVLASFHTVTDAVFCAAAIHQAAHNTDDLTLRIGIHLGEVVFENEDVFGDGVNIAARIQAIANPGTTFVSESVHHNVSNKKTIQTKFVKEESLKNVKEPVRIYEIAINQSELNNDTVLKTNNENRIAVLPFDNFSPSSDDAYLAEGFTEELISDLSRIHALKVISRNSAFAVKQRTRDLMEVARLLDVRFILEGSVRRSGDSLRITAQLIDGYTDAHIWAEKYNGNMEDVFQLQEQVSRSIVDALKVTLTPFESKQLSSRSINNTLALECYLRGRAELHQFSEVAIERAQELIDRGLSIDCNNALLLATQALIYWRKHDYRPSPGYTLLKKAKNFAEKALQLDPDCAVAMIPLSIIPYYDEHSDIKDAFRYIKKALELDPGNVDALMLLGAYELWRENIKEFERLFSLAISIDPLSLTPLHWATMHEYYLGRFDELARKYDRWKNIMFTHQQIALFYCLQVLVTQNRLDELKDLASHWSEKLQGEGLHQIPIFIYYGLTGDKSSALKAVTPELEAEALYGASQTTMFIAQGYALIGEKEKSLSLLNSAVSRGFLAHDFLAYHNPLFESLRKEPEFSDLLDRIKKEKERISDY